MKIKCIFYLPAAIALVFSLTFMPPAIAADGTANVTFTVNEAITITVNDIAFGSVSRNTKDGSIAVHYGGTTDEDCFFKISGASASSLTIHASDVSGLAGWSLVDKTGSVGFDEIGLTWESADEENPVNFGSVSAFNITTTPYDILSHAGAAQAPVGRYGGTMKLYVGDVQNGQVGQPQTIVITWTVTE